MVSDYLFIFDVIMGLVIGYWYNVLAEKMSEPGATLALVVFIALLCVLFDSVMKLGELMDRRKNLVDIAPSLATEWIIGSFLVFFPMFYVATFNLPNVNFYVARSFIMFVAWVMPIPYTLRIIKEGGVFT